MSLVAMAKALAIFVGYTETKYENDPLQIEDTTSSVDDLDNSLGGATARAKELKKVLMGFDVLNVITTPTESSGGGGAGSDLEIDPAILNALKEYDNQMEGIRMKAIDIRDKLLQWLGFTWDLDEEGNIINLKLKDGYTNLEKIRDIIIAIIAAITTFKIAKGIVDLAILFKELGKIGTTIKTIFSGTALGKIGTAIAKFLGNPLDDIAVGIKAFSGGWATFGESASLILGSIGSTLASLLAIFSSILAVFTLVWGIIEVTTKGVMELTGATNLFGETTQFSILGLPFAFKKVDDSISETTKNAVEPFIEKLNKLGTTIWDLNLGGVVTQEDVQNVKTQTEGIANTLKTNLIDKTNSIREQLNDVNLFPDVTKRQEYLATLEGSLQDEQIMIDYYQSEINKIVETAANENRNITDLEREKINELQRQMGETGIQILSANEEEALTLKARFNDKYGALNTEQLMDTVKQAKELKDKTIAEAQTEYDKKVALAEQMKATIPGFTEEMYNQMIEDAKTNKDATISEAESAYQGIVDKVKEKYPEVSKTIDFETGEQKNGLQLAGTWISSKWEEITNNIRGLWDKLKTAIPETIEKVKNKLSEKFTEIKEKISEKITEIKNGISETFTNIRTDVETKINGVITWLKDNFKLPELKIPKLPHIGLSVTFNDDGSFISKAAKVLGLAGKPYFDFYTYATGGFPEVGEMFIAREAGPELVGSIGNRTAVVNNQQIVESVSRGVAEAVSRVMGTQGGNYNFYLDSEQMTAVVTKKQNRQLSVMGV